jgi:Tfp pilus assembly protein PilP
VSIERRPVHVISALLAGLVGLALLAAPSAARQAPAPPAATPAERAREQAQPTPTEGIQQILEEEEEVLSGEGYTYDPGNRRDPFKSLLAGPERTQFKGPRPEGIPGLLIDEIDLKGIFRTGRGYAAQVKAANQAKSYLIKEGDHLYDGDVVSIGKNEVVFKQTVQDPTALKPFREVVKKLNPA